MKKKRQNELAQLLIGLVLLVAGGYMFLSHVRVSTGFYSFRIGSMRLHSGAIIIPFIVGIIMMFASPKNFLSKLVLGLSILLIIVSIILGTQFYFPRTSLYDYLVMIVGIFGGITLILKVLLKKPD